MASAKKQLKMVGFINHRMRIDTKDGRQIVGEMLGFDKHMNIVLVDAREFRKPAKNTNKTANKDLERVLGMIIIRGHEVVSAVMDGLPTADPSERLGKSKPNGAAGVVAAPGISRPAGRGAGLQGPAAGVGGPGFGQYPAPGAFPPGVAPYGGPPGFGRGGPGFPPGGPGFPQGAPGFGPPGGFPPQFGASPAGRGFPPPGGFPGR